MLSQLLYVRKPRTHSMQLFTRPVVMAHGDSGIVPKCLTPRRRRRMSHSQQGAKNHGQARPSPAQPVSGP